jgi:hypothetical protein
MMMEYTASTNRDLRPDVNTRADGDIGSDLSTWVNMGGWVDQRSISSVSIHDHESNRRLGNGFPIYGRLDLHLSSTLAKPFQLCLQDQLISRNHRFSKLDIVDPENIGDPVGIGTTPE